MGLARRIRLQMVALVAYLALRGVRIGAHITVGSSAGDQAAINAELGRAV